ncbi:MAG: ferrous iron transport protein B [Candidatus Sumerlaeaceae bacterium]|nr:ferrous iron transport protein B [Candidatus Sumerlaeaceae bacterium]
MSTNSCEPSHHRSKKGVEGRVSRADDTASATQLRRLVICGPPNVGKSLLFNCLTGRNATVSNYPGTTVTVSSGRSAQLPEFLISDTPGAYSLQPISEEEHIAREILIGGGLDVVVHVVDAKNLRRMLPMTLELLERRLPVVLVLNMMDEARRYRVSIDTERLGQLLGVPVVATVATTGEGLTDLCCVVRDGLGDPPGMVIAYGREVREAVERHNPDRRGGPVVRGEEIDAALAAMNDPAERGALELAARLDRQALADRILAQCAVFPPVSDGVIGQLLNRATMNMWTAIPIAALVMYFGIYKFVGGFGAGTLVDLIETDLYEKYLTPLLTDWVTRLIPSRVWQDLFVHDYGVLTLGLRYALALILPIVGTFFLMFSILEDSGYLPRLALLLDRVFKKLGLNGRAVIPIVIGFGCGTMATMVTRILETKRERVIATLLLGFAIPCSAQIGVVMAMTAANPQVFLSWLVIVAGVFLIMGLLAARHMPGEPPAFYLEMPPLRLPRLGNVLSKTYSRMHWYFLEILPLFLAASVIIWLGHVTGTFGVLIGWLEPLVRAMGLPQETASALLFGFFRRDYGAAGLFELQRDGALDPRQTLVSVLVITLFLPCIAQFFVMKKERGWKFASLTLAAIFATATVVGVCANYVLMMTGWLSR